VHWEAIFIWNVFALHTSIHRCSCLFPLSTLSSATSMCEYIPCISPLLRFPFSPPPCSLASGMQMYNFSSLATRPLSSVCVEDLKYIQVAIFVTVRLVGVLFDFMLIAAYAFPVWPRRRAGCGWCSTIYPFLVFLFIIFSGDDSYLLCACLVRRPSTDTHGYFSFRLFPAPYRSSSASTYMSTCVALNFASPLQINGSSQCEDPYPPDGKRAAHIRDDDFIYAD
jgi:hypothetical protein